MTIPSHLNQDLPDNTPPHIRSMCLGVEGFTDLPAINIRTLTRSATEVEISQAWALDRNWFRGYAEQIIEFI